MSVSKTLLFFCLLGIACGFNHAQKEDSDNTIVFEGTVARIGLKRKQLSGVFAIYRLVEYDVTNVVRGKYVNEKMIVDHLVLTGREMKGLNVGSKVCVEVQKTRTVSERMDDDILRKSSDEVDWYYVGRLDRPLSKSACRRTKSKGPNRR